MGWDKCRVSILPAKEKGPEYIESLPFHALKPTNVSSNP
jgi:hypothetical protein